MDERVNLLKKCYLFTSLADQDLLLIAHQATHKTIPKGTLFMEEGKMPNNMYVIISGLVKVFHVTPDGKEIILALRSHEDVVGEFELLDETIQPRSVSIQAMEETQALVLSTTVVLSIADRYPSIFLSLARYILKVLRKKNARIEQLVAQSLPERTLAVLKRLQKYFPNNEITLSHEDIASLVHATRPRITEALNSLAKDDKIQLSHKSIRIV